MDPIQDGTNWYVYCSNNPIRFIDPFGLRSLDEITVYIDNYQNEFSEIFNGLDFDSAESGARMMELQDQLMGLYGEYNGEVIAAGNLDISDYIENGIETGGFGEKQGLTGQYQTTAHPGIDGVGGSAKSPFYTQFLNVDQGRSNTMTLDIIGTDLKMQIAHGDKGSYSKISGGISKPGQSIIPFPMENNNDISSTAPHFHFQISNGTNFVNPYTMKESDTEFKFTNDGGASWRRFRTNF